VNVDDSRDVGSDGTHEETYAARRWFQLSRLSLAVLIVIAAASVALGLTMRGVVGNDEQAILHERASELSLVLDESLQSISTLLPVSGEVASSRDDSSFDLVVKSLIGASASVVVFEKQGGSYKEFVKDGHALTSAAVAADQALIKRAASTVGIVGDVVHSGSSRWLAIAVASGGKVVLDEEPLGKVRPAPVAKGSPFVDVNLALYASSARNQSDLIAISGARPSGTIDREVLTVGNEKWLLLVSANEPLVGSIAEWSPWVLLFGGLLTACLVTFLLEGLTRRRSYAMRLVAERTASLELALEERQRLQDLALRAREDAEQANRYKSEFMSRMSHELRTPLNAVVGFAQLLELDELSEDQRDSVDHILKGGQHLLKLINEVLDIARIEAGDIAMSPEPVLVRDSLKEVVGLMRSLADQRGVRVNFSPDSCTEYVLADGHRLKQVLLNLLSNAVKYNRPDGSVSISCEPSGETRMRIKVADTGIGLSIEQRRQIFTPFARLGAENSDIEGTGIGLSLSRQLAEAMGGSLDLESVVGEGSVFWIELPLAEGPIDRYERLGKTGHSAQLAGEGALRHVVLHIENNLANINLVQRIVARREGIEIIPAMQGRLGLDLAREHLPMLILLDLHLPDISGDDVLQQLRRDPATSNIPVVMVSAEASPGQVQRLMNTGALAYLTKPIDVNELLNILDRCIEMELENS
jgi:signal transduction histidine kinase/ActR/RegA family two-component response regulator